MDLLQWLNKTNRINWIELIISPANLCNEKGVNSNSLRLILLFPLPAEILV
jgi:hypothetical protein